LSKFVPADSPVCPQDHPWSPASMSAEASRRTWLSAGT